MAVVSFSQNSVATVLCSYRRQTVVSCGLATAAMAVNFILRQSLELLSAGRLCRL